VHRGIAHRDIAEQNGNCLRLLLSLGIDGFHEWYGGDGWVQSQLEGVSLVALDSGQTASLLRLREFLAGKQKASE